MTREQKLDILILLSALESWSFAEKHYLPDYLHERLSEAMTALTAQVLE